MKNQKSIKTENKYNDFFESRILKIESNFQKLNQIKQKIENIFKQFKNKKQLRKTYPQILWTQ